MARIDSPPIRRAKIRCARLCSSLKDRTGFAAGADIGLAFDETARMPQILSTVKDLSKKFSPASLSRGVRFDQYVRFSVPLIGVVLVVIPAMLLLGVTR
jgi:hypothetical protein